MTDYLIIAASLALFGLWTVFTMRAAYHAGLDAGYRRSRDMPPNDTDSDRAWQSLHDMGYGEEETIQEEADNKEVERQHKTTHLDI